MLASVITDEVGTILNDMEVGFEHTRWPLPELLSYITEAIAAIAQAKPAVFTTSAILSLSPGSTQRLSDDYCKLLDIHFNLNRDGSEGANILPAPHELLQAFPKASCAYVGTIMSFSPFVGSDRYYSVSPPVPAGLGYTPQVQALVMITPQPVTSAGQPLFMPSSDPLLYQGALVDWSLYRCYAKDQESNTSMERSQLHFRGFQSYLGISVAAQQNRRAPAQTPRVAA